MSLFKIFSKGADKPDSSEKKPKEDYNAVYQRDVQEAMYQIDKIEEVTRFDSLS